MSGYRFHLQKYKSGRNSKLTCPQCSRKQCFVRYIDEEGKITFPDYVGRCDHEDSCGYHYTPKDLFQDKPDMKPNNDDGWRSINSITQIRTKVEPVAPSYIPVALMRKTLSHYGINPLYQFLCKTIGKEGANKQIERYMVGTVKKWGGAAVYWQVDRDGNVRAGDDGLQSKGWPPYQRATSASQLGTFRIKTA